MRSSIAFILLILACSCKQELKISDIRIRKKLNIEGYGECICYISDPLYTNNEKLDTTCYTKTGEILKYE